MALPPGYADSIQEYPNHAAQLLQHLQDLRKDSRLHDVVLKLADGEWRAHKCVLSAYSGFFRALFIGSGSRDKEVKLKTVTCKGIGPLLEYMYTGKLELVEENVMEVFCTAGYLQVFNVLSDISKFLSNTTLSSQHGRHSNSNSLGYNSRNDSMDQEDMYNESMGATVGLQQDLRSQSPDSGTQSGEEFRTEEETMSSLSGNSFEVLAAQMSEMTADAFAQVLSLDLTYNGQNSTMVDSSVIMNSNGLPSVVVLDQGKVEQVQVDHSSGALQVVDILEGEARMDETQNKDTHRQFVGMSTQDSSVPSLEQTSDVLECSAQSKDFMLQEPAEEKVNSSKQVFNSTTADGSATCGTPPMLDVGTAGGLDYHSSKQCKGTENEDLEEQDGTISGISVTFDHSKASDPLSETQEGQVEHQGKFQNVTGEQSQSTEVDSRDSSPTIQAGDVPSEPKTLGTDDNKETTIGLKTDLPKNVRPKRKAARKNSCTTKKKDKKSKNDSTVTGRDEVTVLLQNNNVPRKRRRKLKNDPYLCNICGEELQTSGKLRTHLANHEGGKKHECPICSAKFGYSNHLADHMRIHTGERPYKCNQCDANFKQKSTLIRHTRRHTGLMPYRCSVCNLGFHDTTHLKHHQKTHSKAVNSSSRSLKFKEREEEFTVTVIAEGDTIGPICLSTEPSSLWPERSCISTDPSS
ncbi:uncharacterized protein LOC144864724 [Branchiostoma floridae x Branchiostoma japonicum]